MIDKISKELVIEAKKELTDARVWFRDLAEELDDLQPKELKTIEDIINMSDLKEEAELITDSYIPMQNWIDEYWQPLSDVTEKYRKENIGTDSMEIFEVLRAAIRGGYVELT